MKNIETAVFVQYNRLSIRPEVQSRSVFSDACETQSRLVRVDEAIHVKKLENFFVFALQNILPGNGSWKHELVSHSSEQFRVRITDTRKRSAFGNRCVPHCDKVILLKLDKQNDCVDDLHPQKYEFDDRLIPHIRREKEIAVPFRLFSSSRIRVHFKAPAQTPGPVLALSN